LARRPFRGGHTFDGAVNARLEVRGLTKSFDGPQGRVDAVAPTSFALAPGEFFSLLGPSGCGKSTTLRMIAGLEAPSGGTILLDGEDITALPPERRDINLVFQGYALFAHLTVWDNVAFGLRRRGVGRQEIRRRVGDALDLVSLNGFGSRRPRSLSGGQQQRVALARALVNQPKVLLLDEPLGALDLQLRESMQIELGRIQRETGVTFIYVTHDQGEALSMSDRIAVLNRGAVEQIGTPREIYRQPATRFVASFIGVSNVLDGVVTDLSRGRAILRGAGDEHIELPDSGQPVGAEVTFTIRPEHITLHEKPGADDSFVLATVADVAFHGSVTRYLLQRADGTELVVLRPDDDRSAPGVGEQWWASWPAARAVVIPSTPTSSNLIDDRTFA
jgi:spermidine/putrescine transport system ATP-binding protein